MPNSTDGLQRTLFNRGRPAYHAAALDAHRPGVSLMPDVPERSAVPAVVRGLPDCAPLFAETYVDGDTACRALLDPGLRAALAPTVSRIYRWEAHPAYQARVPFDDFLTDLLTRVLFEKVIPRRGFQATSGAVTRPFGYLRKVVVNGARSLLRRRELDLIQPEAAGPDPLERVADQGADAEALLIRGRELAFVREVALSPVVSLRANLRFAFLAHCFPPDVTPAHVDAAKAEAGKQEGHGMLRSAEETWGLLQEHLVVPRVVPATDEDGRLAFAWICRSRNKSNPATWRAENPRDAARALDTVDEWLKRAREKLETQGLVRGGEIPSGLSSGCAPGSSGTQGERA